MYLIHILILLIKLGKAGYPHPGFCHFLHPEYTYKITPAAPLICVNLVLALGLLVYSSEKKISYVALCSAKLRYQGSFQMAQLVKSSYLPMSRFTVLGMLSTLPLFLIPIFPFVYLNIIREDVVWSLAHVHPDYTYSLGLAIPSSAIFLIITSLLSSRIQFNFFCRRFFVELGILSGCLAVLMWLSNSSGALKIVAVILTCFLALKGRSGIQNDSFKAGFVNGWYFLVFAQTLTIAFYGLDFSWKSNGIMILGLEVYQALVSYSSALAIIVGMAILTPRLFLLSYIQSKGVRLDKALYYIFIISGIFNLYVMGRRSALLVVCLALAVWIFRALNHSRLLLCTTLMLLAVLLALVTTFYDGPESFDFANALLPRLSLYIPSITEIYNGTYIDLLFGVADGWSTRHNLLLDLVYHSGLVGVCLFTVSSTVLIQSLGKLNLSPSAWVLTYNAFPFLFILFAVAFDNLINTNLYLVYYTVNIMVVTLLYHHHVNAVAPPTLVRDGV